MRPPAHLQGRLDALAQTPVNYNPEALDLEHPSREWTVDDRCTALPAEKPGPPASDGSFAIASRLIRGYEFADPSLVRAFYDHDAPLEGRTMLLELRALGLVSIHVGVRVIDVFDNTRECEGRTMDRFGWAYRTLEGHVERGQMDWQVWKWRDTGEVQFRVYAVSRVARIVNPVIWAGFHLLRGYERRLFLDSTGRRMQQLTERALHDGSPAEAVRAMSSELTARASSAEDPAHEELASELREGEDPSGQ